MIDSDNGPVNFPKLSRLLRGTVIFRSRIKCGLLVSLEWGGVGFRWLFSRYSAALKMARDETDTRTETLGRGC